MTAVAKTRDINGLMDFICLILMLKYHYNIRNILVFLLSLYCCVYNRTGGWIMEITWYGHSCFRLTERSMATVVTDPFDSSVIGYESLKLRADILTVSHEAPGHSFASAVKGVSHVIDGPGEFEIGGVFLTGVQTDINGKKSADRPRNTLYVFDYDGLNVSIWAISNRFLHRLKLRLWEMSTLPWCQSEEDRRLMRPKLRKWSA